MNSSKLKRAIKARNVQDVAWIILEDWLLSPSEELRNADVLRLLDIASKAPETKTDNLIEEMAAWVEMKKKEEEDDDS
jgi:hypothetical protein